MNINNPAGFGERFSSARILVVGDVMLDRYLLGSATRISPEAPVPVVNIRDTREQPGGAANVALNIATLGAQVRALGVVGTDQDGSKLEVLLRSKGVKVSFAKVENFTTTSKTRVVAQNQQIVRLDFEPQPSRELASTAGSFLLTKFIEHLSEAQVVVVSDYMKGAVYDAQAFISTAKRCGKRVLVDPKGDDFEKYCGADVLKPNFIEFERVVGTCSTEEQVLIRGANLREQLGLSALLVTRGAEGMILFTGSMPPKTFAAQPLDVFDVTGAGDTVIAVLAVALGAGFELKEAVTMSNIAAGVVVGKSGAASVRTDELASAMGITDLTECTKELALVDLLSNIDISRRKGERIVMTNGCFDVLHPGHVSYLRRAKELGDRLIVAVNSDDSVRRLKGPTRPINKVTDRIKMLAALSSVDWVVSFDEDTPQALYKTVLPDILVKGNDYEGKEVSGATEVIANGGKVVLIDFLPNYSTSAIIRKIQDAE